MKIDRYLVVGMRIVNFQNNRLDGHNMDFTSEKFEDEKYEIICLDQETSEFNIIECYTSHGMCSSGWTTASYGNMKAKIINAPGSLHYIPKERVTLDNLEPEFNISNTLFWYSEYGFDEYYPSGSFRIKLEGWRSTGRMPSKSMVHVFHGVSATGKSTIASLTNKTVIESDSFETPEKFIYSLKIAEPLDDAIIVIGGKHEINLNTVFELLSEKYTVIKVNFSF